MNKPRRCTDLDNDDLDILIRLCDTRLHTVSLHIKRNSFADSSNMFKAASQLCITVDKLKKLKVRLNNHFTDGA